MSSYFQYLDRLETYREGKKDMNIDVVFFYLLDVSLLTCLILPLSVRNKKER